MAVPLVLICKTSYLGAIDLVRTQPGGEGGQAIVINFLLYRGSRRRSPPETFYSIGVSRGRSPSENFYSIRGSGAVFFFRVISREFPG